MTCRDKRCVEITSINLRLAKMAKGILSSMQVLMENLKQTMTLNRNKRNSKIVRLYIVGSLCMLCYFILENSNIIPELVEKSNTLRYKGFVTFFLIGLLKYGILIIGIGIIIISSFLLFRKKTKIEVSI